MVDAQYVPGTDRKGRARAQLGGDEHVGDGLESFRSVDCPGRTDGNYETLSDCLAFNISTSNDD